MPSFTKDDFSGGQVSRRLQGRKDLQEYSSFLDVARNVIIEKEGMVTRRPGGKSVFSSVTGAEWKRDASEILPVPFKFSNKDQYVLLFRDLRMDVYRNGSVIAEDIVSPWSGEDLRFDPDDDSKPGLKFSQAGDFMVVTHPNYTPRLLVRENDDGTDWSFDFTSLARRAPSGANLSATGGTGEFAGTANAPSFNFRFVVFGIWEGWEYLSEVTGKEHSVSGVAFANGIASVVLNTNDNNVVRVGDRVSLDGLGGAVELNDRVLTVRSVEYNEPTSTLRCVWGPWRNDSSRSRARAAALRALPSTHRGSPTYDDESRSVSRTVRRIVSRTVSWQFSGADFADPARANEYVIGTNYDNITNAALGRLGNALRSALRAAYPSLSLDFTGSFPQIVEPPSRWRWNQRRTWKMSAAATAVSRTQVYSSRARGCRTVASGDANVVVGLQTDLTSVSAYTSGGRMTALGTNAEAKRDAQITLKWDSVSDDVDHFAVFQKAEGGYGLVYRTAGPLTEAEIQYARGDETQTPPSFRDPFEGSNPNCSAVFQQRRAFGGFSEGNKLEFSRAGVLNQFDASTPVQDDDGFSRLLASTSINEIRHLVVLRDDMMAYTGGAIWRVTSNGAFTPYTAATRREQEHGASNLNPLAVGDLILHVSENNDVIHATRYNFDKQGYVTSKMSNLFSDILNGRSILSWDKVEGRMNLILAVLDNGRVIAITFLPDTGLIAAAYWEFASGYKARSVAVVNNAELDPEALFLMEDPSGDSVLWSMDLSGSEESLRFSADGVRDFAAASDPAPLGKADNAYLHYRHRDRDAYKDLNGEDRSPQAGVPYSTGLVYDSVVRTVPVWFSSRFSIKTVQVRLLEGSEVDVRALPGGEPSRVKDPVSNSEHGLSGTYEVSPAQGASYQPQVQVAQSHPSPWGLLGLSVWGSDEPKSSGR